MYICMLVTEKPQMWLHGGCIMYTQIEVCTLVCLITRSHPQFPDLQEVEGAWEAERLEGVDVF